MERLVIALETRARGMEETKGENQDGTSYQRISGIVDAYVERM